MSTTKVAQDPTPKHAAGTARYHETIIGISKARAGAALLHELSRGEGFAGVDEESLEWIASFGYEAIREGLDAAEAAFLGDEELCAIAARRAVEPKARA